MNIPPGYEDHDHDDTFHVFGDQLPAPRSGDDATFEVLDEAITALGFIRRLWMGDDRVMIHIIASLIDQAQRCLPHLIAEARHDGSTWTDIATLLGTSPEQAKLRFDPDSPTADRRPMLDLAAPNPSQPIARKAPGPATQPIGDEPQRPATPC